MNRSCLKIVDWLKPLDLSKVKTKNNRDLVACAFSRWAPVQVRFASSSDQCTEFSTIVLIGQTIRHFWVNPSLCFKARLSASPLIWKWLFFILMHIKLVLHEALCWKWEFLEFGNGLLRKCSRHHVTIGLELRCGWETSTTCNDKSLRWLDIDMKRNDSTTKRLFLVTWWWNCSWISFACSCCRIISSTFLSSEQQKVKFQYWRRLDDKQRKKHLLKLGGETN